MGLTTWRYSLYPVSLCIEFSWMGTGAGWNSMQSSANPVLALGVGSDSVR